MLDAFGYAKKQVIVSGCFSGIGRAVAELLLAAGAEVHGIDICAPEVALASFHRVDLRDSGAIDGALAEIAGQIDGLFNCAGIPPMHPALDVLKVNFIAARHLSERVMERMPSGSAIVSVGSNGGAGWREHQADLLDLVATRDFDDAVNWCAGSSLALANPYGVSKEAIVVWTMQASAKSIERGIRINCTSPGAVQTPMLDAIEKIAPPASIEAVQRPSGRRSTPTEQAWPLLMLGSDAASYINGIDLPVDGGFIASKTLGEMAAAVGTRQGEEIPAA